MKILMQCALGILLTLSIAYGQHKPHGQKDCNPKQCMSTSQPVCKKSDCPKKSCTGMMTAMSCTASNKCK
jgi:hypothetical protein